MKKVLDVIEKALLFICMLGMTVINFGNVLGRRVFGFSWGFTEELLMIFFVYATMVGASVATKRGANLGFSSLYNKLPRTVKKVVIVLTFLVIAFICVLLIRYGYETCLNSYVRGVKTPALRLTEAFPNAAIPIGGLLILIRSARYYYQQFKDA